MMPPAAGRARRIGAPGVVMIIVVVCALAAAGLLFVAPLGGGAADAGIALRPPPPAQGAGASAPGAMRYPVPEGALFVSPAGSDSAPGTEAAPLKSVQRALAVAVPQQTIVLRQGSYHQRTTVTSATPVTIQPYPGEEVWFDGSAPVAGWRQAGAVWVHDGWVNDLDTSPTYTRGAPDNTEKNWAFINPAFPLAAHPDQVWVGGVPQRQVAATAEVGPGTFAVDDAAAQLVIGDNPVGTEVRASVKTKAFGIQAAGSVLRGVGIRGYATSVPGFGAVTVEAPGVTIEQLTIEDNAGTGLFVGAADAVVEAVTVRGNGMMGFGANKADDLRVSGLVSEGNNTEHFNNAPVSGGAKITLSQRVVVRDSRISDNLGPGLWFDQSNFDVDVLSNTISGNQGHGLFLEISSTFVVAGNTIAGNRNNGIKLNNTNRVEVWNNTITDNERALLIAQDHRRAADSSQRGRDPARGLHDPVMTWIVDDITVSNNVFSGAQGVCIICVEDYSGEFSARQLGVTLNGNAYQREGRSAPEWLIVWSRGSGDPSTFTSLADFTRVTGQERHGIELGHGRAHAAEWRSTAATARVLGAVRPIQAGVLERLGWPASVRWLGAR